MGSQIEIVVTDADEEAGDRIEFRLPLKRFFNTYAFAVVH
jgi:hypothetical protein